MQTQIFPMLAVSDGNAAVAFYKVAFGAKLLWQLGDEHVVAGLSIDGASFFLADASPAHGTQGPNSVGFTTVRIELFVNDPFKMYAQALSVGASELNPVKMHEYETAGPEPIKKMLQGALLDPFGHMWLIGKFVD
ncbi:MAG TPA: VOC family protein [Candidatus Acidoferrales bacterium]|nr:VOC family protein [Candidatus Acidoferrales bacterium]